MPRLFALSPRHRLGSTKNGGASFDGTTPDVSGKGKGAAWFLRNERSGMDDLILTTSGLFVCKMCVCTFTLWVPRGKLKRRKQKRKTKMGKRKITCGRNQLRVLVPHSVWGLGSAEKGTARRRFPWCPPLGAFFSCFHPFPFPPPFPIFYKFIGQTKGGEGGGAGVERKRDVEGFRPESLLRGKKQIRTFEPWGGT